MRCLPHELDAPVCDGIQPKHQDVERGEGGKPVRFASLRGLVQVAATASSITRDFLPSPEASSPRQLASVPCLAGCHEFSAVGFVSVRGAASRDKAHRDAVHRGGVGFAGVAERGSGRGRGDGRASIGMGLPCCSLHYGGSLSGLTHALYPLRQTCFESPSRNARTPFFSVGKPFKLECTLSAGFLMVLQAHPPAYKERASACSVSAANLC